MKPHGRGAHPGHPPLSYIWSWAPRIFSLSDKLDLRLATEDTDTQTMNRQLSICIHTAVVLRGDLAFVLLIDWK